MDEYGMKAKDFLFHPRTITGLFIIVFSINGWLVTTFADAADFEKHLVSFEQHNQRYELDRTDDKIDDLEVQIFNLEELIAQESTPERRSQLSKYEGDYADYKQQRLCLERNGTNCRRNR